MTLISEPIEWADLRRRLCLFICSRTPNGDDAEDILQEVLLRVHTHYDTLRDMQKLESWIYQIARNSIIDHYRSNNPTVELSEELISSGDAEPESAAEELAPAIKEIIATLPEVYQQALLAVDYQGMSQAELARQLNVSLSTIKSRTQRARQMVRANLLACCHFEFDRYGKVLDYYHHCVCCCSQNSPC